MMGGGGGVVVEIKLKIIWKPDENTLLGISEIAAVFSQYPWFTLVPR